jgi:hypothetical protein
MTRSLFASVLGAFLLLSSEAVAQQANGAAQSPAPRTMSRRDLESEVSTLRSIVQNGAVVAQRPARCSSTEDRQFDFWVGEWDVAGTGHRAIVAESTVTLADEDCLVLEHWRPFRYGHAHSISVYDHANRHWRQYYAGAGIGPIEYTGALDPEGVLRFDIDGSSPRKRMNYQRIDANTVRQWGEQYDDATHAWTTTWDLTYRRRGVAAP